MASSTKRSWRLQEFVAHGANVNCLALGHKSGRVLVTGGDDRKVNLWAVGKHNCILSLSGHVTPVECVKFNYTEEVLCAGSQAGTLKIWDLEASKIVRTLTGHKAGIRSIDFHPYGDFLVSGSLDTALRLWDVRRKGCIFTYKGHKLTVNSVKFSPDGQWIVSGGEEGNVKMWDLRAGRLLKGFVNHTGPITDVEFHPNEFLLASSSVDRTVNFWDLDKLQLVSSTDRDSGPVRCVHFSEDGECLFAGSQDILKVYCWEPPVTFDTVPVNWGKVHDIATTHHQLIGATFHQTNVVLFVVDLKKVRPFGGEPNQYPATFVREQSFRRSFNRDKTFPSPRPRLDVKTIEESDRSGTDPEDESQLTAEIPNVADYQAIFQPNRKLTRTPPLDPDPFPAPLDDDPTLPQIVQPVASEQEESLSLEYREAALRGVTVREPPSPTEEVESVPQATSSPRATHASRRLSYTRDPMSFPEVDFPIKLSSIRHSPSEPALNRPSSSLSRNNSLGRNLAPLVSRFADKQTSSSRPKQEVALVKDEHKEEEDFIPILTDKPSGLDLEEFLPKSYSRTFGYQQTFPDMSEAEVLSSMMRGHESVMTVLSSRQRSLQIVYSLWHNKDLKTAVDSAIAMSDQAIIVDLLGVILHRQSIWNLDLCATILPCIYDLVQSKYEVYMMVGCDTLRLILRNFASVIKTNVQAPIQTVGVDISREERYEKCVKCYQSLLSTRAFLLKRQTLQGKLGHTFRELHILMETLD